MTDFTEIPRDRTLLSVRVFLIALVCALVLLFLVVEALRVANGEERFLDRLTWGPLLATVAVALAAGTLRGRAVGKLGREAGGLVIARWEEAPGLRRYFAARRRTLVGAPYEMPARGAVIGTTQGIELRSTTTRRRIAWAWSDIRDIEIGRVVRTSGATSPGLILTIAATEGDDRVPVQVRPGVFRPFVTRRGMEELRADLLALRGSSSE